ncbi:hypothetical protein D1B31_13480 [Neobacillus notoginsengisoli]|uniref:Uncharacterized protein n=1 Tax=Neobacillus notoginsengisoli TaxID=1578198 RepID=A0A417YSK1_9BACI|nr:hypothetical protein D1B31_13480 [Neobacillus notoginsengisoli]
MNSDASGGGKSPAGKPSIPKNGGGMKRNGLNRVGFLAPFQTKIYAKGNQDWFLMPFQTKNLAKSNQDGVLVPFQTKNLAKSNQE